MENIGMFCRKCEKEIKQGEVYVSINWHEEKLMHQTITVYYAEEVMAICNGCASPYSPAVIYDLLADKVLERQIKRNI